MRHKEFRPEQIKGLVVWFDFSDLKSIGKDGRIYEQRTWPRWMFWRRRKVLIPGGANRSADNKRSG